MEDFSKFFDVFGPQPHQSHTGDIVVSALVQSCLVFLFLTVFFFTYVHLVEQDVFKKQVERIVTELMQDFELDAFVQDLPVDQIALFNITTFGFLEHTQIQIRKKFIEINQQIEAVNAKVVQEATSTVLLYTGVIVLMLAALAWFFDIKVTKALMIQAVILLAVVAVTEYLFLNYVTKKYVNIESAFVKKLVAETMLEYINKNRLSRT